MGVVTRHFRGGAGIGAAFPHLMTKRALSVLAVIAVVAVPCVASAQGGTDAKLKAGIALVKAHDNDKAVAQLTKLYVASKDARCLYWMARAHQDAGRHADALRAYKQFLKEAPNGAPDAKSVDVLGNIQTLTMQVGTVGVTATDGATIFVDDVEIGTAPLKEPIALDPGKHTISASWEGKRAASKIVDVAEESRQNIELRVDDVPAAPTPAPAEPASNATPAAHATQPTSASSNQTITYVGLGVATVLAAGSVFFTVKAAGTAKDFDSKKGELGVTRGELDDLQGQTRLQAGLAVGLGLSAVAAAGITLFVLKKPNSERRVLVTGQGVALAGSF